MMTGPAKFITSLTALGHKAEPHGALVVVNLEVPLGPLAGTAIDVGTDPPQDFPRVPPHWLHLPERLELPGGKRQPSQLGAGWSKWSRQHPRWRADLSPTGQWLAHVRALLEKASLT